MLGQGLQRGPQQVVTMLDPVDAAKCAPPDSAATFEEVGRQYIAVKEPRWGAHASATAKCVIRKHLIGNLGHRRVDELTAVEIQTFIEGLVKSNARLSSA